MCQYSPEQWNVESKIVYVNDNWMMHQMVFTFAGAIEYFIDKEWDLIEHMVNFYHIQDKDHEGQWAAKSVCQYSSGEGRIGQDEYSHLSLHTSCMMNLTVSSSTS